jgi:hypothetical protein
MQESQPVFSDNSRTNLMLFLLIGFFVVFNISALIIQNLSGEAPNAHGTIVDMFNGSVLWMASMLALLTAVTRYPDTKKLFLWLTVSAGAGAFAVDEMFEIHEQTLGWFGDDDYIKIVMLLVVVSGLIILYRMEKPSRKVAKFFATGFFLHLCYLVTDFGDGDFFQLPFSIDNLYWAEEAFEMLAVQTYFAGLMVFYMTQAHLTSQESGSKQRQAMQKSPGLNISKQPS